MLKKPFPTISSDTIDIQALPKTQIDIWGFTLDAPLPTTPEAILSHEEIMRANRFHFEHHRHGFTRARMLLRQILSAYLKQPAHTLVFDYGQHGKPFLKDYPHLEFNLSHSGNQALLAVGKEYPLGIDIEQYAARPYMGIGKQVFSAEENQRLDALPDTLKPLMFFNTWAQKEAFIKLLGLGLSYPVEQLTVDNLAKSAYRLHCPIHHQDFCMLPFMPRLSYAAAICYHPDIQSIRFKQLNHKPFVL